MLSGSPPARAAGVGRLQRRISQGQNQVSTLSGAVNAESSRLGQLGAGISRLQGQISGAQADLQAKAAELLSLRGETDAARARLGQLVATEARAEQVLSTQLVGAYESDRPDLVTVVLESNGFADLLNQIAFAQRIQAEDAQVVGRLRDARRAVAGQATTLGGLESRQQSLTDQVLAERNRLAETRLSLIRQRIDAAQLRDQKASQLAGARDQLGNLEGQLAELEAQQAPATKQSSSSGSSGSSSSTSGGGSSTSGSGSSGSRSSGRGSSSGRFTFPLPKSAAAPPGTWSPDEGVDISAPGDTPEYAVCSGTIVLHGIGGFGPWAPVLHCDNPIDGYSYVYYGHAGPENQLPVGAHVTAGQVISSIGPGIVGISTGPHLELGFADSNGSPIGSQTASTMLSLLTAAYNG